MSFTCDEHDVFGTCEAYRRLDRFTSVGYCQVFSLGGCGQILLHVVDDRYRIFTPWIIACEDGPVAMLAGSLCHDGSLCSVPVASASHNCDHFLESFLQLLDCGKHIQQGIRSMCVIHDRYYTFFRRKHVVEPSFRAGENAEVSQNLLPVFPKCYSSSEYREEVVRVELSYQPEVDFLIVHIRHEPCLIVFNILSFEVGQCSKAVVILLCGSVLQHHFTALVIEIADGEGV